jgi:hypothetical protein
VFRPGHWTTPAATRAPAVTFLLQLRNCPDSLGCHLDMTSPLRKSNLFFHRWTKPCAITILLVDSPIRQGRDALCFDYVVDTCPRSFGALANSYAEMRVVRGRFHWGRERSCGGSVSGCVLRTWSCAGRICCTSTSPDLGCITTLVLVQYGPFPVPPMRRCNPCRCRRSSCHAAPTAPRTGRRTGTDQTSSAWRPSRGAGQRLDVRPPRRQSSCARLPHVGIGPPAAAGAAEPSTNCQRRCNNPQSTG